MVKVDEYGELDYKRASLSGAPNENIVQDRLKHSIVQNVF